jgi:hypothetical protein
VIEFAGSIGATYVVETQDSTVAELRFPSVSGTRAVAAKMLGRVQIGLLANSH